MSAALEATLAAAAALAPRWAVTTPTERARVLRVLGAAVEAAADELVPIAAEETSLPPERLRPEVARTAWQFELAARVLEEGSWLEVSITHADPAATPPVPDHRRMNIPLGPVLVFAASNFPFAFGVLGTDTATALAAGCPVVAKGHPGHPRLAAALAALAATALAAAGADTACFARVADDEAVVALRDPRIAAGAFTGSTRGGIALGRIAQERPVPIPFYAEMGSVNPVIVTPAAWTRRRADILEGLAASMTTGNGQLCTSPGVVFVPEHGELAVDTLDALPASPMITDAVADQFRAGVAALAAAPGVTRVAGRESAEGRTAAPSLWSVDVTALDDEPQLLEERFGPAAVLVRIGDPAEALAAIDRMDGQLTASVFAEDDDDIDELLVRLGRRAGRVLLNQWPTGVAVSWSMHHGGPWPASSAAAFGSVGAEAIRRFLRPVAYQGVDERRLPAALQDSNPWRLPRRIDGVATTAAG